jgi:hypothetical protein
MASQTDSRSRHANNAELQIDGEVVAELLNINVRESGGVSPVQVAGTAYPVEHTYDRYSVNVSASRAVFKDGVLAKYGVGGSELVQLPPMDIVATDVTDGGDLFTVKNCTLSDRSTGISANTRISADLSWMGTGTGNA